MALSSQYRDQYPFSLRLAQPLQLIPRGQELAWAQAHPAGALVFNHDTLSAEQRQAALAVQAHRGDLGALWLAATLVAHPEYLDEGSRARDAGVAASD